MIFRTPLYYNKFRCTAEKCTDNCCIGWEIDIDSETLKYYNSIDGDFGSRLKENISSERCFILKNERCPFLNENNLCDIIINCGENRLCQICRDHPRYFEWYGDIKEGGIGLSCEEGARLILTNTDKRISESEVQETVEEINEELLSLLFDAREKILSILNKDNLTLGERLSEILDYAEKVQFAVDNFGFDTVGIICEPAKTQQGDLKGIVSLFSDFEPIDEGWKQELTGLTEYVNLSGDIALQTENSQVENYLRNLFEYFIWRYFLKGVFDEEILSKVKFSVVSILIIKAMTKCKNDLATWIEKSKLYSKQMEYSEENKELFFDYTYEKQCLSSAGIKGLLTEL